MIHCRLQVLLYGGAGGGWGGGGGGGGASLSCVTSQQHPPAGAAYPPPPSLLKGAMARNPKPLDQTQNPETQRLPKQGFRVQGLRFRVQGLGCSKPHEVPCVSWVMRETSVPWEGFGELKKPLHNSLKGEQGGTSATKFPTKNVVRLRA